MINNAALISALKSLLLENILVSSFFNQTQQKFLNDLAKNTGIIKIRQQGRGFSYQVINISALQNYLKKLQPLDESELKADLPMRSRNIGLYKNSKQINSEHTFFYLLLKAVGNEIHWQNNKNQVNISEQTKLQGVSSLMIEIEDNWQSLHPLFLVENQALFDYLDWLPANFNGSVVYYGGHIKQRLLNWLSCKKRASELILFADYDGVGLNNFLRLSQAIKNKQSCHFYLMPNWKNKLSIFGNPTIWRDNQTLFQNSVQGLQEIEALTDELKNLIHLMQALGKGLEQESIWL